jgi:predicted unusual protein kinase regulating ubiquinone biosynthesis (AarF/ABC1/UbiB family)
VLKNSSLKFARLKSMAKKKLNSSVQANSMGQPEADTIQNIRTGLFVRSLALARIALSSSRDLLTAKSWTASHTDPELQKRIEEQAKEIARELGLLKGSVMKVGQLLSMFGEHFLPPHVNSILKTLQCDSPSVEWKSLEKMVRGELGTKYDDLEIDPLAFSAASIGQVHRAKVKSNGKLLALKIQYPGVEKAIENDIRTLKTLLNFAPGIPKGERTALLLNEVDEMLKREIDYHGEASSYIQFRELLADDKRFYIPAIAKEFSTTKVLAIELVNGYKFDSDVILSLSQERRNHLGQALLELYLRELFQFGQVQTDAHIGNFLVRLKGETNVDGSVNACDQIVLLDYGAVRSFSDEFLNNYAKLVHGALTRDAVLVSEAGTAIGFLKACDSPLVHQEFYSFCSLVVEPFQDMAVPYSWEGNDLPQRLANQLTRVIQAREFRAPPREVLFLDRKSTGLYVLLSKIGAKTNTQIHVRDAIKRRLSPFFEHSKA